MKRPTAIPLDQRKPADAPARAPKVFVPDEVVDVPVAIDTISDVPAADDTPIRLGRPNWMLRLLWTTAGILVSLGLGLAADALVRNLFETQPWLGWLGVTVLVLFVLALIVLVIREIGSLWRLQSLDHLKSRSATAYASDRLRDAQPVVTSLKDIYANRADLSRPLATLTQNEGQFFDGGDLLKFSERTLMTPLDARARALTATSARRVALVTAVSPRALIDVGFVIWESVRLGGAIARLYGARPGLWSSWRLVGAIVGHLAVTGGLVLTDGIVEQLVGQGLAARVSHRLGEGVVNGLMTVRVGIAAMRVVRPLPFTAQPQPAVKDFLPELVNVLKSNEPT
jgi:putative membrane protein